MGVCKQYKYYLVNIYTTYSSFAPNSFSIAPNYIFSMHLIVNNNNERYFSIHIFNIQKLFSCFYLLDRSLGSILGSLGISVASFNKNDSRCCLGALWWLMSGGFIRRSFIIKGCSHLFVVG